MAYAAEIAALAKELGRTPEGDGEALASLALRAEEELTGRLRPGVTAADCEGAFVLAGAWLALALLCVGEEAEERTGFSAGSLTIRQEGRSPMERAAALRRQAEQVMGPWLKDRGFAFRGVRG